MRAAGGYHKRRNLHVRHGPAHELAEPVGAPCSRKRSVRATTGVVAAIAPVGAQIPVVAAAIRAKVDNS